jgi:uncharacterized membrane protein YtjA (UPF0391 family)
MEKRRLILADVLTFGSIALVAALFGFFHHTDGDAMLIGRVVCAVSLVLVALSLTVRRPPSL